MSELAAIIQAVLFAVAEPLSAAQLTAASRYPEEDVLAALDELVLLWKRLDFVSNAILELGNS